MEITVEYYATARQVTKKKEENLALKDGANFYDLMDLLAARYPKLVGDVIDAENKELTSSFVLNVNANRAVQNYATPINDGERVLILLNAGGG